MADMGHLHTIDADRPFLPTLVAGLLAWDRERLADTLVLLPSRRACLAAREAFRQATGGRPLLLPRLAPIGEPDEAELALDGALELALPPAIPPLRRRLLLTRLILARDAGMAHEQAVRLAAELARFLDELHHEEVALDRLEGLAPEALARHWQDSMVFLRLLRDVWPAIIAEEGRLDAALRRRLLLDGLAAKWRATPPPMPVVAAGVSASIPAVARLLAVIAGLPHGSVVLHALDQGLEDAAWREVGPSHPQFGLKRLLELIGRERGAVRPWPPAAMPARPVPRMVLWSETFRPAATTEAWRLERPELTAGTAGIELDVAPDPASEAVRIALRLRRALETPGRRAALVTTSRALGRRVAAELLRWGVRVDDSAGVPLDQSPPGSFLLLAAQLAAPDAAPVALLAALKHPLAAGGLERAEFRRQVRELELQALRGIRPAGGLPGLAAVLATADAPEALSIWLATIAAAARPLGELLAGEACRLGELLGAHLALAEWLARDAGGAPDELWAREAGRSARAFMDELAACDDAAGPVPAAAYPAMLALLMGAQTVRPERDAHPRLAILGQIEARLIAADLVVLGDLNEGSWPPPVDSGPWLNRAMRLHLGMPPAEQAIGIAAHDFLAVAGTAELVLSRAAKDANGAPTVASRWISRLQAVLAAADRRDAVRADPLPADWARRLDQPPGEPRPIARPRPCPPAAARPRELWATDIERLIRDPYQIYARHILQLRAIDPIDADAGGAERGQIIHAVLQRFVGSWPDQLPPDPRAELLRLGLEEFAKLASRPQVWAVWWPRFERIASWFAQVELRRRAEVARVAAEVRGAMVIEAPGGQFRLRARADRIEVGRDGRIAVVDYKTGPIPAGGDVASGLSPQLSLEALIAERGGYERVDQAEAAFLLFVQLKGNEPLAGVEQDPLGARRDLRRVLEEAAAGVERLIAHFDDPATPYLPIPRPDIAPAFSDYEHLARVGEWHGTEAEP
jgi:ATP-dependent helicase/nuclease subunit B